jgi:hypothetical protein
MAGRRQERTSGLRPKSAERQLPGAVRLAEGDPLQRLAAGLTRTCAVLEAVKTTLAPPV